MDNAPRWRGGGEGRRVASQVEVFSLIKKRKSKHVKVKAAHSYSTMTKRFFPLSCSIFSFRKVYATFFFSFRIDFFVKDYLPKREYGFVQCGVQSNLKMLIVTVFCKNVENSWEVIYVSMLSCEIWILWNIL